MVRQSQVPKAQSGSLAALSVQERSTNANSSIPPNGPPKPSLGPARTSGTRRTAPKAADLVSAATGHGEEEGSDNDGELSHHSAGCVTEQEIDCFVSVMCKMVQDALRPQIVR